MRQLLGALLIAAAFSTAGEAQTLRKVPGDFPTIQAAISASQSGDTVLVAPGVYVENITFSGKAITVVSQAGPDFTTIDGNQTTPVVRFASGEGPNAVLDGFTIRNGYGSEEGAGIRIYGASPTVQRNRIVNNRGCGGAGIMIYDGSPLIQANTISGNTTSGCSGSGGAGILITFRGSPQIINNTITNNVTGSGGGGLALTGTTTPLIRDNIITGNQGSGINLRDLSSARILQNLIAGNTGGGISWSLSFSGSPSTFITNNTIVDNDRLQGSAIFADGVDSSTVLTNNIIVGKKGQTAIYCGSTYDNFLPAFAYNNVFAEQAAAYGGICPDATGTVGNISAAPSFVDRAAGNFRLLSGSSGIDEGDNSALNLPAVDLDTIRRILGGTVDMGAYEFAVATTSTLSQLSLTFADQDAGTVSAPTDITLTNTGSATLMVSSVAVSGQFSQTNTCQTLSGIPAGQGCTISVRFAPTAGGPRSGQLTIGSNSVSSEIDLSGNGVAPLTLSTTTLSFGPKRVGTTSQATVNVSNTGIGDLGIGSLMIIGADFTGSSDCPSSLSGGSTCTITIQFAPTVRGARSGSAMFVALGSPQIITFSGSGLAPTISFTPTQLQFSAQPIGGTSAPQSVTVANQGDLALSINSISISGNYSGTNDCGTSLAINATCTINVVFSPTAYGSRGGSITVADDAIGSPHSVGLIGFGSGAPIRATPETLEFGNQGINTTSAYKSVTLSNVGNTALTITSIVGSGEFSFIKGGNCTLFFPGAACFLSTNFKPTSVGSKTGALTITTAEFTTPTTVPLSGTGVDVGFSPTTLAFDNVQVGTTATRTATFTNNSPNLVNITGVSVSTLFSQQSTCGASLAPGDSCSIDVTFAPVAGGFFGGTLAVTDDAVGSPHTLTLSGRGVDGRVSLSPTSLSFAYDLVGTTSPPKVVTLSNSGAGLLTISAINTSGDFAQTNNCGTPLPPNSNCSISITFSPTAVGTRNGSLTVVSDGSGSPDSMTLTGSGGSSLLTPTIFGISPANIEVGSAQLTLTVSGRDFSSLSIVRLAGVDRPTTFVSNSVLTAILPPSDFATIGTTFVSVFNPTPGGGVSGKVAFSVYRASTLSIRDLIYDRIGNRIYASVPATAPNLANTLTPIDPTTGAFGASTPIGTDPGKLVISNDSRHIYVSLNGTAQVRPFDLESQTAGAAFALGSDPSLGPYYVEDMAVAPGKPETLAVSRIIPGLSPRHAGVAIYDNGVKRSSETASQAGSNAIEFSLTPSILYGYDTETTEHGFRTMSVDPSGVAITNVDTNLHLSSVDIQFEGGRIYTAGGAVIDPVSRTLVGWFPSINVSTGTSFVADSTLGRAFYVRGNELIVVDVNTFASIGSLELPVQGYPPDVGSLIRWGEEGLAFRADTRVIMLRLPESWLPPRVPAFNLVSNVGLQGQENLNVAVNGQFTGFIQGQTVASFGPGITVNSLTIIDPGRATANITIAAGATTGPRYVAISTGQPTVTLSSVFTVVGTSGLVTNWGANATPIPDPMGAFKAIAAGDSHSLAMRSDGRLMGWGSNSQGQINVPTGLFTAVAAGGAHSLAISTDTQITGWGSNSQGQINIPFGSFVAVAAGATHSLGIRMDGTLAGWGANDFGQANVPTGKFLAIAGGATHSLAIRTDGTLAAWGYNGNGQINVPAGTFTAIAAGSLYSLGLRTDGTLVGWGDNAFGQINVPAGTFIAIAAGTINGFAIRSDGTLISWGFNSFVPGGSFKAISVRGTNAIAIMSAQRAPRDFNGDGKSDVLWRDTAGNVSLWQMNGVTIASDIFIGNIWMGWTILGSGDFNADGKADILWRDPAGNVAVWLMDGSTVSGYGVVGNMPLSTTVSGVADFNGDQKADILWRGGSGDVRMWLMNGTSIAGNTHIGNIWMGWTIVGTGDFNGDGKADILWRELSGDVSMWLMNGATVASGSFIGNVWTGWTIAGTGDFNGDGKADILWREISGDVGLWLMNGSTVSSSAVIGNIWPGWVIAGVRDFDGNSRADILWRDTSGNVGIWLMNGTTVSSYAGLGNVSDRMAQ